MKFSIGDKVKFLNTKGEGIIKRIIDSKLVLVTIEGGFDIPVLAAELILDVAVPGSASIPEKRSPVPEPEEMMPPPPSEEKLSYDLVKSRKSEDVFLGFIPHDQKWLISGPLDVVIINNSEADLLYVIYRKNPEGGFWGVDYGSVPAESKVDIAEISREELPVWIEGTIQLLFYKENCDEIPLPFNADYSLPGKKFYADQNYRESRLTRSKSIILRIATLTWENHPEPKISVAEPSAKQSLKDDFIFRHKTGEREAEVDLHITEIVEDYGSLEKSQILEYQKNYFLRCLESAIVNHFRKVIFIHGVGNGVLRGVLLDHLLKQKGIDVFDAPMSKYGVGAVEVRIAHNI